MFLRYLRYERNYSSYTVFSYKNDLQQFEAFRKQLRGDATDMSVETDDIRNWVVEMNAQGVSARTIARKISALRSYYRYAINKGLVADSPVASVKLPKIKKRLPSFVRPETMSALLRDEAEVRSFEMMRNNLIVTMLYETGMRRAELIGLKDVDVDNCKCEIKVLGKRNKERIIPYGKHLQDDIEAYRQCRNNEVGHTAMFFVKDNGEPIYAQLVYRVVKTMLGSVSTLAQKSPHVMRHTFASAMLNDGAGINSVKELLGHSTLASTEVYTHITFEELKQSYKQAHPRATKKGGHYGR